MIDLKTARELALRYVNTDVSNDLKGKIVICDEETVEKDYGWIFFYQTEEFLRTGDMRLGIVGNGPIVVLKADGSIDELPSNNAPEQLIADYEQRRRLKSNSH